MAFGNRRRDPFEIVDRRKIDEELAEAIENPERVVLRPGEVKDVDRFECVEEPDWVTVESRNPFISGASVDIENNNLRVFYSNQLPGEKYYFIGGNEELALVENRAKPGRNGKSMQSYYVVAGDECLFHVGNGNYEESLVNRPRDIVYEAEELFEHAYRKIENAFQPASEMWHDQQDGGPDPVPPPENDSMF